MLKYFTGTLMLVLLMAISSWAQDENAGSEPAAEADEQGVAASSESADTVAGEKDADEDVVDDADLDVQTYEEDEDDFIPTEEIPADEPIPFPSNI